MQAERLFANTSLFLRYLTNNVPVQADAVGELFYRASAGEGMLVIAKIVGALES